MSPKTSRRKTYELEKWVTAERKKLPKQSSHEGKYLSESSSKPINLFDLEEER